MIKIKSTRFAGISKIKIIGSNGFTFEASDYGLIEDEATESEDYGNIFDETTDSEDYYINGGFSNEGDPVEPPVEPANPATYNYPAGSYDEFAGWALISNQNVTYTWIAAPSDGNTGTFVVYDINDNSVSSPYTGTKVVFGVEGVGQFDYTHNEFFVTITATDAEENVTNWTAIITFYRVG